MSKLSSKVLIFHPSGNLYATYRAIGPWSCPNTFSLIGTDGDTVEGVIEQIKEKLSLVTTASDWELLGKAYNETGDEINSIWRYKVTMSSLCYNPSSYGGLLCIKPSDLWIFDRVSMLSPSAASVMRARPEIFSTPQP